MSEIPEQFIREARELLAAEYEKTGWKNDARACRTGEWDRYPAMSTLARVLFERQQPTFEQRVEAWRRAGGMYNPRRHPPSFVVAYDTAIAEIMRPKVDPVDDVMKLIRNMADDQVIEAAIRKIVAKGDA